MKPVANFKKDLLRGKAAEDRFLQLYPNLKKLDGYKGDFMLPDGRKLELKSDHYSPFKWSNVIIERYGSATKNGGPWQAKDHGCDIFAYWFCNHDLLLLYPIDKLIELVENLIVEQNIPLEDKINERHTTRFYRIKRIYLNNLLLDEDILK